MIRRVLTRCYLSPLLLSPNRHFHLSGINQKTIPSNLKGKSKGSQEWLIRQLNDPFVKKARELNYRARSAFKLLEIDDRFKLLKKGMVVVECGAAPGAWSQVVVNRINSDGRDDIAPRGKVIGIDLLPIDPLPGAIFLANSDFTSPETQARIQEALCPNSGDGLEKSFAASMVDLILSDMAPNASGIPDLDQAKLCQLVEASFQFASRHGRPGSHFVAKVWDGTELNRLEQGLKSRYKSVQRIKPKSSRDNSSEIYLVSRSLIKN